MISSKTVAIGLSAAPCLYLAHSKTAKCDTPTSRFNFAVTLNPMYEKRYKQGEDNYVAHPRFICVVDGVGGWVRKMVDPGLFTKEFVKHIEAM